MSPSLLSPHISLPPLHFLYGPYLQLTHLSPFWHAVLRKNYFHPAVSLLSLVFSLNNFVYLILYTSHNSSWQASSWVLPSITFFLTAVKCMFIVTSDPFIVQLIQHKLPEKFYIIYSGLWFLNNFELGVFKCEVRESVCVCFTIYLVQLKKLPVQFLLILWVSINRSSRCLSPSSIFSDLVHEELPYRIKFLIRCHCCNTYVPPQRDWDCRLNDSGPEKPLKNHGDPVPCIQSQAARAATAATLFPSITLEI